MKHLLILFSIICSTLLIAQDCSNDFNLNSETLKELQLELKKELENIKFDSAKNNVYLFDDTLNISEQFNNLRVFSDSIGTNINELLNQIEAELPVKIEAALTEIEKMLNEGFVEHFGVKNQNEKPQNDKVY